MKAFVALLYFFYGKKKDFLYTETKIKNLFLE